MFYFKVEALLIVKLNFCRCCHFKQQERPVGRLQFRINSQGANIFGMHIILPILNGNLELDKASTPSHLPFP